MVRSAAIAVLCASMLPAAPARAANTLDAQHRIDVIDRVAPTVVTILEPGGAGGGSGVLIDPVGYGLTNFHVIAELIGKGNARAGLPDGKTYPIEILGIDPTGDLAMFRLRGRDDFPAVMLGDAHSLRVGDPVLAMGNPFLFAEDFTPTVTHGIVSGLHRYQKGASGNQLVYTDCIQVDASINPGNSGGPLFDADGRLIGINGRAAFEERGRVNVGLGFAITIDQIKRFIPALRAGRLVQHGTLNATVKDDGGRVVFDRINSYGAAANAGIEIGDELVQIDGQSVASANQLASMLGTYPADWVVPVVLRHDSKERTGMVRLDRLPVKMEEPYPVNPTHEREAIRYVLQRFTSHCNSVVTADLDTAAQSILNDPLAEARMPHWSHGGGASVLADDTHRTQTAELLDYDDGTVALRFWFDPETQRLLAVTTRDEGRALPTIASTAPTGTQNNHDDMAAIVANAMPAMVKVYGAEVAGTHGYATGVIVSPQGEVVTTWSLLLDTVNLRAVTADGRVHRARVIKRDLTRQLALLALDRPADAPSLPYLSPGDSAALQSGDWVLAVGNPFKVADAAEELSVQLGILTQRVPLSARHRLQEFPYQGDVLLVDAITGNPGSAGGALLDAKGNWVGLVGKGVYSDLTHTRLNYALPIEEVTAFLDEPRDQPAETPTSSPSLSTAEPGYHGIHLFRLAYRRRLPFVERVDLGSPADIAGLRRDDLILSLNGQPVTDADAFERAIERFHAGDRITLTIKRDEQIKQVELTLEAAP